MRRCIVLPLICALLLHGCAGPVKKRAALVLRSGDAEYMQSIEKGAADAALEFELELTILRAESGEQPDMVNGCIRDKADAVILAPNGDAGLPQACADVLKRGIPLVTVDSAIASETAVPLVASSSAQAANMLGRRIVEWSGGAGRMAVISCSGGVPAVIERETALLAYISANSGITLSRSIAADDAKAACEAAVSALSGDEALDIIMGLDAASVTGAAEAIRASGRKVLLFGFDCSRAQAELLEDGELLATAVQSPYAMGYLGVKSAYLTLTNQEPDNRYFTPVVIITKDNMFTGINQKMVFPFNSSSPAGTSE